VGAFSGDSGELEVSLAVIRVNQQLRREYSTSDNEPFHGTGTSHTSYEQESGNGYGLSITTSSHAEVSSAISYQYAHYMDTPHVDIRHAYAVSDAQQVGPSVDPQQYHPIISVPATDPAFQSTSTCLSLSSYDTPTFGQFSLPSDVNHCSWMTQAVPAPLSSASLAPAIFTNIAATEPPPGHSHTNLGLSAPYALCRFVKPDHTICGHVIFLQRADAGSIDALRAHVRVYHPEYTYLPHDPRHHDCPWDDGKCRSHAARIKDVPLHVYHSHLGLTWPCNTCNVAQWHSRFALERHQARCVGAEPARCGLCKGWFASLAALNVHCVLRECVNA
jgi:hypothetical protein